MQLLGMWIQNMVIRYEQYNYTWKLDTNTYTFLVTFYLAKNLSWVKFWESQKPQKTCLLSDFARNSNQVKQDICLGSQNFRVCLAWIYVFNHWIMLVSWLHSMASARNQVKHNSSEWVLIRGWGNQTWNSNTAQSM